MYKLKVNGEKIDTADTREEADYMQAQYTTAFHSLLRVEVVPTQGQQRVETIAQMRAEGMTHPAIAEKLGMTISRVDQIGAMLVQQGQATRRKAGPRKSERASIREEEIAAFLRAGIGPTEISRRQGWNLNTVRATAYKLRKAGRASRIGKR